MAKVMLLTYGGLGIVIALILLIGLERRGRRDVVVWTVLGIVLLDGLLYPGQGGPESLLFYPVVAGQHLRLPEIIIPLALIARFVVHGVPRRPTGQGLAWAAFFLWYATAAVVGLLYHNPFVKDAFDAKAIIFVGGGYALAAGVPASQVVGRRAAGRWVAGLGAAVAFFALVPLSGHQLSFRLPLIHVPSIAYTSDPADCVVSLAALFLVLEICRERPRRWAFVGAGLLILSPFLITQRAALLSTAVTVGVLVAVMVRPSWPTRAALRWRQVASVAGGLVAAATIFLVVQAEVGGSRVVANQFHAAISGEEKLQSAHARLALWGQASHLIGQKPLFGWGLGKLETLHQVFPLPPVSTPAHDMALDLLVWTGAMGLGLFVVAVGLTLREAWRVWMSALDRQVAALALGAGIGVIGLLTIGVVESVFEQYRLATVLGLLLGFVTAASRARAVEAVPSLEDDLALLALEGSLAAAAPLRQRQPTSSP